MRRPGAEWFACAGPGMRLPTAKRGPAGAPSNAPPPQAATAAGLSLPRRPAGRPLPGGEGVVLAVDPGSVPQRPEDPEDPAAAPSGESNTRVTASVARRGGRVLAGARRAAAAAAGGGGAGRSA